MQVAVASGRSVPRVNAHWPAFVPWFKRLFPDFWGKLAGTLDQLFGRSAAAAYDLTTRQSIGKQTGELRPFRKNWIGPALEQ